MLILLIILKDVVCDAVELHHNIMIGVSITLSTLVFLLHFCHTRNSEVFSLIENVCFDLEWLGCSHFLSHSLTNYALLLIVIHRPSVVYSIMSGQFEFQTLIT